MYAFMVLRFPLLVVALVAALALPATAAARAPEPILTGPSGWITPNEGQTYALDASYSFDRDNNPLVAFDWDLDGDGSYEISTGSSPYVTHAWTDRGVFTDAHVDIALRVTDAAGESTVLTVPIQVTDEINGWFVFQPQLVNPGDAVQLKAYTAPVAATPPAVLSFAWDLDGDGTYEHSTGASPEVVYVAPEGPGKHAIGLQVTDDLGNTSRLRREIEVLPRHPSRDLEPWGGPAPANLGITSPGIGTVDPLVAPPAPQPTTAAPVVDQGLADALTGQQPRIPQMGLKRVRQNSRKAIMTLTGPAGQRFRVIVFLEPDQAKLVGLPRRKFVLARSKVRIGSNGTAKLTVVWNPRSRSVLNRARFRLRQRLIITVTGIPY